MEYFNLGNSGLSVSRIALGCWGFAGGSMWGDQSESDSIDTVSAALDAGINLFETAQGYGNGYSEEVLGKALAANRHRAIIATKIRIPEPSIKGVKLSCEQSLKRLQTDYIDLLQPHWPNRQLPAEVTLQALIKLRQEGKIRAYGLSNYGVGDLSEILRYGNVASNQLPYSLLFRAIEYEVQPLCIQEDIGILCYSTLLHGLLSGKYHTPEEIPDGRARTRHFSSSRAQVRHSEAGCEPEVFAALKKIRQISNNAGHPMALVSVAWVLHQPGVASVLVGARKPDQITQMATVASIQLEDQVITDLSASTERVKQILGTNPDMWMSDSRFR